MLFARRRSLSVSCLVAVVLATVIVVAPAGQDESEASSSTPIMQRNRVTPQQMAAWYQSKGLSGYDATVPMGTLAQHFIDEGRAEGIAGDLAFVQSVLETSWFRFPSHGQVRGSYNNFAGIGACDGGSCTVAQFPSARIGVRAQIQHLRAYADPNVTVDNLWYPLESPRFHLVLPKGRASTWEQMGGGDWATDVEYGKKILRLYDDLLDHARSNGGLGTMAAYGDVRSRSSHADDIVAVRSSGWTNGCRGGFIYCPERTVTRGEMASFLVRAAGIPVSSRDRFEDVPRSNSHHADINALAAAGYTNGCSSRSYCPDRRITRAEMASFLQRAGGLPDGGHARFDDVDYGATHGRAISAIADAGLTNGCGRGSYCPDRPVTRAEMASFLRRAFG